MRRLVLAFILLLAAWPATAAEQVPVVVAVDTSRSLSAADLEQLRHALDRHLAGLPAGVPFGLVAFADEARWVVPVGASHAELVAGLGQLRPEGNFTVLQDALVVAAREMPRGGVIVVATDGRDEGSATTVDDVARLCASHDVRIVAGSGGRRLDQRALRRLALLSKGAYIGRFDLADSSQVAEAITETRAGVASQVETLPPPATIPTPQPQPPAVRETTPEPAAGMPWWILPLVGFAVVAVVGLVVWILARRREPEGTRCERCGTMLEAWETSCSHCQITELEEASSTQTVASTAVPDENILDPEVFKKSPIPEGLDNTLVLDEQPVLVARQRGRSSRSYVLPRDQIFVVGRAPDINTLQVEDPTVSAQHFKVVPKEEHFFLVALDTTNGTMVNDERVKVRRLKSGDVLQAGGLQFEFKMKLRRLG